MRTIMKDLYQFSTYIQPINLSFNQYLLNTKEPLLVHTGDLQQASKLLPQLKELLNGKMLSYIFVSHFESDECGGLRAILEEFPNALTICSEITARQISGFGLASKVLVKKHGETLKTSDYELEFYNYPSEMHLWNGLLLMEKIRNIFFSSDLMMRFGEVDKTMIESNWKNEVSQISQQQIPHPESLDKLQQNLLELCPNLIAPGHGPCLKV